MRALLMLLLLQLRREVFVVATSQPAGCRSEVKALGCLSNYTSGACLSCIAINHARLAAHGCTSSPIGYCVVLARSTVFAKNESGVSGAAFFRMPGFIQSHGVLMAFAEQHVVGCDKGEQHNLVLRRSVDGGHTWEPVRTLVDGATAFSGADGRSAIWDPTPVASRTGTVFVFFSRSHYTPHPAPPLHYNTTGRVDAWMLRSTNRGVTWGALENVTDQCACGYKDSTSLPNTGTNPLQNPGAPAGAFTGGHGIQLSSGRLIVPVYY
jgi:sialidase-1